jgi:CRP/FNR family transcriptional regulator, dissimilatory nitrate respiration regulator
MYELLSKSAVFKDIEPGEIKRLLTRVRSRVRKYEKGQVVAFSGDNCEDLFIVLSGVIKGEMQDMSGKSVEVGTMKASQSIAPAFLFGHQNRFPVDAVVVEDAKILALPRQSLVYLMQLNSAILTNFLNVVSNRTHFLTERLWFMSFKTIKEKFAHYLLKLVKPGQLEVTLPKSQQELSKFFAVSRPSLARVIGEMQQENIIQCHRREIVIKDLEKLKELVE